MESWRMTIVAIAIGLMVVVAAGEDKPIDKEACREQRLGVFTCLPYLKGQAKSPTSECCSGLKQMLNSDKNCVCGIIQDRNDPNLGLQNQVIASLAFTLPSLCHVITNVTKCPAVLHLDPKSPEAQVFYYIADAINKIGPASPPTGSAPEPTSMSPTDGNKSPVPLSGTSHTHSFGKQCLMVQAVVHFFVILYIFVIV